ncbi:MAG: hypothetical protein ACOYD6_00870 [Limnochordia bacterium]|jgi:hypothetical protein
MWPAFFRNLAFALVLLALVALLVRLELPGTQHVEEYLVFVLNTEFDFSLLTSSLPSLEVFTGRLAPLPWTVEVVSPQGQE